METKKMVKTSKTTTIVLTDDELEELVLKASGLEGGKVVFDISSQGYLRGAEVSRTIDTFEEE